MIKFFRKIRQQLLKENRFSQYLLYAIGEIVLVVIGILIALQIDNWNENRKLEVKTQNYYKQILEDLHKDKTFSAQTIKKFESQRKAYHDYISKFESSQYTLSTMYRELLDLNAESYALNFNTSTIESLTNSGEIALIPPLLRNKLLDLKRMQQKITLDESLDNRAKTGVTERISMLIGSPGLENRLEHQRELKHLLDIEKNKANIILGLEGVQDWMDFSEKKSIRQLKELVKEIETIEKLILKEMASLS